MFLRDSFLKATKYGRSEILLIHFIKEILSFKIILSLDTTADTIVLCKCISKQWLDFYLNGSIVLSYPLKFLC